MGKFYAQIGAISYDGLGDEDVGFLVNLNPESFVEIDGDENWQTFVGRTVLSYEELVNEVGLGDEVLVNIDIDEEGVYKLEDDYGWKRRNGKFKGDYVFEVIYE